MRHLLRFLHSLALLGLVGLPLVGGALAAQEPRPATLFTGGTVFAGFDGRRAEPLRRQGSSSAILVQGGRIVGIGNEGELASLEAGRGARRVDLTGGFIYPGFQDAHGELERLGRDLEHVELSGCADVSELIQALQARAAALPAGRWVRAGGWHSVEVGGATAEARRSLAVAITVALPDHPVILREVSGEGILLNEAGWSASGLGDGGSKASGDQAGARAAGSGGWLDGAGADAVQAGLPAPTGEDRARRILRAQEVLLGAGVTCVHVMGLDSGEARALAQLRADGRLRIRVVGYLDAGVDASAEEWSVWERDPIGADRFEMVGVSLRLDGSLAAGGAALGEAYKVPPGERGTLSVGFARASDLVTGAARLGRQPAIQCAGDRAVGLAIDIYDRVRSDVPGFIGLRPRLEGLDLSTSAERSRLGPLAIVPSVQPARLARQAVWAAERLGRDRALGVQAWRSLLAASSQPLALGSGYPAGATDPRLTFFAGVSRRSASEPAASGFIVGEGLTANEVLGGMTSGAAFAATQEDRRGLLARGYGGDLTVLDVDLTQLGQGDARRALDATVLMTVVNGEILHDAR